jgi:hypothetical protein
VAGRFFKQTINEHELWQGVTLQVTFVEIPSFRVRKWIATKLIRLAAIILGCGIEVINDC